MEEHWKPLTITPENQKKYNDLCKKLTRGAKIYGCGHLRTLGGQTDTLPMDIDPIESPQAPVEAAEGENTQEIEAQQSTSNSQQQNDLDLRAIQGEVVRAFLVGGVSCEGLGKGVRDVDVVDGRVDSLVDDVVVRVCRKVEAKDGFEVALVGRFVLLPKLYHLESKLATPVMDALTHLMEAHSSVLVDSTLLPLLQHLPALLEHHRDVFTHLLPSCSPELGTKMLRVYSQRSNHPASDLPTFHLLCERANHTDPETHTAALPVLAQIAPMHKGNVKFGQCLLMVIRKFGTHLQDLEALRSVISGHQSSLKKSLEIQMKKLGKVSYVRLG